MLSLDDKCGRYFTYRDFIQCGETQSKTGISNIPRQDETYRALHQLADQIIDPVCDNFQRVILTYGFCSKELAKLIPANIYPSLDQHASYELNTKSKQICSRGGAACDFFLRDQSALVVAQWLVINTPFDRLYYYGDQLPLHVSFGPENSGQIVSMQKVHNSQHRIPRVIKKDKFITL